MRAYETKYSVNAQVLEDKVSKPTNRLHPTLWARTHMAFISQIPSQMDIIFSSKCINSRKSKSDTCQNAHLDCG